MDNHRKVSNDQESTTTYTQTGTVQIPAPKTAMSSFGRSCAEGSHSLATIRRASMFTFRKLDYRTRQDPHYASSTVPEMRRNRKVLAQFTLLVQGKLVSSCLHCILPQTQSANLAREHG